MEDESPPKGAFSESMGRSLFMRHCQGDRAAFSELMRSFQGPVYSYLVRAGVKAEDRDDLFQEVVLKIHRAREQYQYDRPLFPWIFTIAVNTVRNYHRSQSKRENEAQHLTALEDSTESGESLESSLWLEHELSRLSLIEKEVIILVCIEQIAQRDAAVSLGIPLNTLKTHLRRGRLKLLAALSRKNTVTCREELQ